MFKESKEFPGSVEGTVKFSRESCCALDRGLEMNMETAKQLAEVVGEEKARIFKDILFNTLDPGSRPEMKFVPNEEAKVFYGQIAKRELKRIEEQEENDKDLSCGHSVKQHRMALESVVENLEPKVN